jgi:hypothetical protein
MGDDDRPTLAEIGDAATRTLYDKQTAEQFAAIGRFIVAFEWLCTALRWGTAWALQREGLRNQGVSNILLNNKYLTAGPLVALHDAILTEIGARKDPTQEAVFDQISKEFGCLTEVRNLYVHANWFIGWANSASRDFSEIGGYKGNPSKKSGDGIIGVPEKIGDILDKVERAETLLHLINRAHGCLMIQIPKPGTGKFSANFTKRDGVWTIPPGTSPSRDRSTDSPPSHD